MRKIIIILIILNIFFSIYSNTSDFCVNEAGFCIKYSKNVFFITRNYSDNPSSNIFKVVIQIDELKNLYKEAPFGFDKDTAINEREKLKKGKIGNGIDAGVDIELIKMEGNKYGEIITVLSRGSVDDITFERRLLFFNNDYRIIITVYGEQTIIDEMKNYFNTEEGLDFAIWKYEQNGNNFKRFIDDVKNKKSNKDYVKKWFNAIYEIIDGIYFIPSLTFISTVNNLRFRESPDLNGKYIRSLKQGEKLELIEKGKTETINGTKGTWVKVITEKGEVGWCFDAYLEEVKKK